MDTVLLSICICSYVLYLAGSGVNSVQVVLSGLSMRLLSFVHAHKCCRSDVYMVKSVGERTPVLNWR